KRTQCEGHAVFQLDPLDAVLELATHLATRAGEALLTSGRRNLLAAATAPQHALRLDQVLDLRVFVEARHREMPPPALVARAREWSAEPALGATLECVQMGLGFPPEAREWARQVVRSLAVTPDVGRPAALFRPDPIERLPIWLRPSDAYLARVHALQAGAPL